MTKNCVYVINKSKRIIIDFIFYRIRILDGWKECKKFYFVIEIIATAYKMGSINTKLIKKISNSNMVSAQKMHIFQLKITSEFSHFYAFPLRFLGEN